LISLQPAASSNHFVATAIKKPEAFMSINKSEILDRICYTELVYGRINKKLATCLSKPEIEALVLEVIAKTEQSGFGKTGKNIYVTNFENRIRITINSNTFRVITVDQLPR
jgi:hypothetical protein